MRKSRFSEQQIIAMIREYERGMPTSEVCRKHGISDATFYKYKARFGGMSGEARAAIGPRLRRTTPRS